MRMEDLKKILTEVKNHKTDVQDALKLMSNLPYVDIGFAKYDTHRFLRQGFPEVIFGEGKTDKEMVKLCKIAVENGGIVMVTRVVKKTADYVSKHIDGFKYHADARILTYGRSNGKSSKTGILIMTAGTVDRFVAEEARITAQMFGNTVDTSYDVGVAGLHRLLDQMEKIKKARVIVVAAGMDGALPSVVGGLVDKPVIAVPVSSGYGASFKGLSSLLTMLNSCSPTVAVVNIDNGFGAGFMASLINRL